jgi:hypothetical protein
MYIDINKIIINVNKNNVIKFNTGLTDLNYQCYGWYCWA